MSVLTVVTRITKDWLARKSKRELVDIIFNNLDNIGLFRENPDLAATIRECIGVEQDAPADPFAQPMNRRVGFADGGQFTGMIVRTDIGDVDILTLGHVARGYPNNPGSVFIKNAECTPQTPWSAHVWVPERFHEEVRRRLARHMYDCSMRIGPYRTRQEGMIGLEEWWLKRLGVRE